MWVNRGVFIGNDKVGSGAIVLCAGVEVRGHLPEGDYVEQERRGARSVAVSWSCTLVVFRLTPRVVSVVHIHQGILRDHDL